QGLAYIMGNRALVYWKTDNRSKAKKDLLQAIEMLEPLGDRFGMSDYYNQLGNIYYEESLFDQAIEYTMKGLEMSKSVGLKEQVRDAAKLLYQAYQKKGVYDKALNYQTQYYAYKDSIQNLETTQKLANLRTEYEVGQKQTEVDLLLEQKRSNQIIMITGGIILLVVICLVIVIYRYSKAKSRLNKQLEEQKNSLLVLNQTKDKFFSIISHDLRGPVNSLSGLLNVTRHFVTNGKENQLLDMVDKMDYSIDRLVKLLDNLLNWALQQRGHFPYFPEKITLKFVLMEVIDMFKDMAVSKNISLSCEMDESIELYTDKNATSTILRNLISNAIKFTPDGGKVAIHSQTDAANNVALITVKDDGVGIPKEKLENLFKLNEKISTRGTSGERGVGLGLQLVVEFVELNKGKIDVDSETDKGTTFTVSLPLSKN
ncbi:MAG: tetratricopeptide repeat-containing sensor histidine kinase, partial [Bacteroidota bacterium]